MSGIRLRQTKILENGTTGRVHFARVWVLNLGYLHRKVPLKRPVLLRWFASVKVCQSTFYTATMPEIPELKMFTRARNAFWMSKRTIGIRGFRGVKKCRFVSAMCQLSRCTFVFCGVQNGLLHRHRPCCRWSSRLHCGEQKVALSALGEQR
jgi:hypothetical protein